MVAYIFDTKNTVNKIEASFIKTVKERRKQYTKIDIRKANEVTEINRYHFQPSNDAIMSHVIDNKVCYFFGNSG